VLAFVR
jgi:hypothetical protein